MINSVKITNAKKSMIFCVGFLLQSKDMKVRLTGNSYLPVGVNVIVNSCPLCIFIVSKYVKLIDGCMIANKQQCQHTKNKFNAQYDKDLKREMSPNLKCVQKLQLPKKQNTKHYIKGKPYCQAETTNNSH